MTVAMSRKRTCNQSVNEDVKDAAKRLFGLEVKAQIAWIQLAEFYSRTPLPAPTQFGTEKGSSALSSGILERGV